MNTTIRCAIVDDEPLAVRLIENFIARTPFLELAASFTDSVEALEALRTSPVDVLFLDIQMPDMDGLELSRVLPAGTHIIFTTAFKEYAFESYEVNTVDYLLKPIRYDKFLRAAERARARLSLQAASEDGNRATAMDSNHIFLRVDGEFRRVNLDDLLYVEGLKDYVRFVFAGAPKPLTTHMTMRATEEALPADRFMRVSRSHIVALDAIKSVDRNMCIYLPEPLPGAQTPVIKVTDLYRQAFQTYLTSRTPSR